MAWYEAEIRGFSIRNNYKPELTSAAVAKVWDDNENFQQLRPASIAMTLLANGQPREIVILNAQNGWKATIENLPTKLNGEPVVYTWKEQKVISYTKTGEVTEGILTTFTNTIIKQKEPTPGTKTPKRPGTPLETLEEYETPLGVDIIINHVGDCFD